MDIEALLRGSGALTVGIPVASWLVSKVGPRRFPLAILRRGRRKRTAQLDAAQGELAEIQQLLNGLRRQVGVSVDNAAESGHLLSQRQRQVNSILETIDHISGSASLLGLALIGQMPEGPSPGFVFLSTGRTLNGEGDSVTIEIIGTYGVQQFTFASGTSQSNIIMAITQFSNSTGVLAIQDWKNGDLVQLYSSDRGSSAFVQARLLSGRTEKIIFNEDRRFGSAEQRGFGCCDE